MSKPIKVGFNPEILKNRERLTITVMYIKSIYFWNENESENPSLILNFIWNVYFWRKWQKQKQKTKTKNFCYQKKKKKKKKKPLDSLQK